MAGSADDGPGGRGARRRPCGGTTAAATAAAAAPNLNTSALTSILASHKRTNARMDRTQFEGAEREFRRVGGVGDVVSAYEEAAAREAHAVASLARTAAVARAPKALRRSTPTGDSSIGVADDGGPPSSRGLLLRLSSACS